MSPKYEPASEPLHISVKKMLRLLAVAPRGKSMLRVELSLGLGLSFRVWG